MASDETEPADELAGTEVRRVSGGQFGGGDTVCDTTDEPAWLVKLREYRLKKREEQRHRFDGIVPLPPWHPSRMWLRPIEVTQYLYHQLGVRVTPQRVRIWRIRGMRCVIEGKPTTVYLKGLDLMNKGFYHHKEDLWAFLKVAANDQSETEDAR